MKTGVFFLMLIIPTLGFAQTRILVKSKAPDASSHHIITPERIMNDLLYRSIGKGFNVWKFVSLTEFEEFTIERIDKQIYNGMTSYPVFVTMICNDYNSRNKKYFFRLQLSYFFAENGPYMTIDNVIEQRRL